MNSVIAALQDHSGSMGWTWPNTAAGFNVFLKYQQMRQDDAHFYMAQFDTSYTVMREFQSIFSVAPLSSEFEGGGSTALFDSIETMVDAIEKRIREEPRNRQPTNVTIVLQSDGGDNASRRSNSNRIRDLIANHAHWHWIYLAANAEAERQAYNIGITNVINYDASDPEEVVRRFETIGRDILEACVTGDWSRVDHENERQAV